MAGNTDPHKPDYARLLYSRYSSLLKSHSSNIDALTDTFHSQDLLSREEKELIAKLDSSHKKHRKLCQIMTDKGSSNLVHFSKVIRQFRKDHSGQLTSQPVNGSDHIGSKATSNSQNSYPDVKHSANAPPEVGTCDEANTGHFSRNRSRESTPECLSHEIGNTCKQNGGSVNVELYTKR